MTSAAVSVPDLPAQSGLKESPKNFFLDADGNAWLVTLSDKLYMYDFQSEAIGVSFLLKRRRLRSNASSLLFKSFEQRPLCRSQPSPTA